MRIIETDLDVAEGAEWLANNNAQFALALKECGPLPLRRKQDGFAQLLNAIVSQQLSVASANSIWKRLEDAALCEPHAVSLASEDELRACGLSRPKVRYAQDLANANIDYIALRTMPSDDVIKTLTAVRGIGTWTAEIYAMFSLGHADVFAPGDLALQESARVLFDLPARPTEGEFRTMAAAWSPWRSVAARLLWAYYRIIKQREGIR